jgi:hypothetical protein
MSSRDLVVALTRGGTLKNTLGKSRNETFTWPALVEKLSHAHVDTLTMSEFLALPKIDQSTRKNQVGAFVGGSFTNGRRNSDSIEFRSVVTLDIDENSHGVWDEISLIGSIAGLDGLAYQLHTTRKHTEKEPRLRIVVPLSRDVTPEEYVPVLCAVAEMVDPTMKAVTTESFVSVQVMFLPTVCKGSDFFEMSAEGDFLNPGPLLKKYPVDKPELWPKAAGGAVKPFSRAKMAHPEDKKTTAPIITAVHRAFTPTEFIDEFLTDVYEQAGDRYSIIGATGAPSVRIYDDAFIQSDHGSDPANGQHNTFDLGRIHLFGDLDAEHDLNALSLVDWPSYRAMYDFMMERPEVQQALAEVQADITAEKLESFLDDLPDLDDEEEDEIDEDDPDDLIGMVTGRPKEKKAEKPVGVQELIRRLRILLGRADNLVDIEAATKRVQDIPSDVLPDSIRSMLCADVQAAYERAGEKITKATAAKALAHRRLSLVERVQDSSQPDWLDGWCHVYGDAIFHHADTNRIVNKDGFDALYSRYMRFTQVDINPKTGLPLVSPSAAALNLWTIPSAYQVQFHPDKEEFFTEDGVDYVNSYRKAIIPDDGYRGKKGVEMLKRLLAELYPDPRHQSLVLDFIAHCVRFPAKKLKYALLLKGVQEEGKTLLYRLLRRLLGRHNCAIVQTNQLKKEFNDYIDGRLLCCVEEIKLSGSEGLEALNNLKPMITNGDVSIEGKGDKVRNVENYCNWLAFTNFDDAVPIEDSDSRWLILFSRFQSNEESQELKAKLLAEEGRDYREDLFDEIDDHPWQFIRFFETYVFSPEYRANSRAPHTTFKTMMSEDGKSEETNVLEELLQTGTNPLISTGYVHTAALREEFQMRDIGASFRGRGVAALMKGAGFRKCKETTFRSGGNSVRIDGWTKDKDKCDREGKLSGAAIQEIREIMERSGDLIDEQDLKNVVKFSKKA